MSLERIGDYHVERWVRGYGREVCLATLGRGEAKTHHILALFELGEESARRLDEEIDRYRSLDHPNLGRVERSFDHEDWRVMVLEYLPGTSLQRVVALGQERRALVDPLVGCHVGEQVFSALAAAHAARDADDQVVPLVHANLGPDQVLVSWRGSIKIVGLGLTSIYHLASGLEEQPPSALPYVAPEVRSGGALTVRGNVFSVAAMMWSLLAEEPFASEDLPAKRLSEIRGDIPSVVVDALDRALAPSLLDRHITAHNLVALFSSACEKLGGDPSGALIEHLETLRMSVLDDDVLAPAEAMPSARLSSVPSLSLPPILSLPPMSDRFKMVSDLPPRGGVTPDLVDFLVGEIMQPEIDITDESIPTIPAPPRDD